MYILKLIRWPNLLIIALVQYLIRFFIIESLNVPHYLDHLYFFLGVVCSVSLAAAGYVINDILDLQVDHHNKPQRMVVGKRISTNFAWGLYAFFNILAFITGYVLAIHITMDGLWLLPVVAAALLYLYSTDLKKRPVIGNILVSLLTALPVFLVGVYDVLPAATPQTVDIVRPVFYVIIAYSLFAFYSNFIRELIKDAEDLEGDKKSGYRTLAVILGRTYIRYVVVTLILVMLVFTGYFNVYLYGSDKYSAIYLLLFVNAPLIYLVIKIMRAKQKLDFKQASTLMKLIMLTGIVSMVVFTLSINVRL